MGKFTSTALRSSLYSPHPHPRTRARAHTTAAPEYEQACWLENRLFLMDKNIFSPEYLNWVCDLMALIPPPPPPSPPATPPLKPVGHDGGEEREGVLQPGNGGVGDGELQPWNFRLYIHV